MNKTTKILPLLLFVFITATAFSQQVTFDWKYKILSTEYTNITCIATDSSGNIYAGGQLDSTVTFVDTTTFNTETTAFLAKLTNDGQLVWFKQIHNARNIVSICFDSENKLYVQGFFYNHFTINDTTIHTANADTNSTFMFFAKLDIDGNLVWAKQTGGMIAYETPYNHTLKLMTIDKDDNIILAGMCIDEIQYFDTAASYHSLDSAWWTYPGPHWEYSQNKTSYIAKYTKNGQKLWVKNTGQYSPAYYSLKTDYSGNILLTGVFGNSYDVVFDSIVISPTAISNIFIAKYNPIGHIIWAQKAGGSSNGNYAYDVTTDSINNIYFSGIMDGSNIEFAGTVVLNYTVQDVSQEAFIVKLDSSGIYKWIGYCHNSGNNSHNAGVSIKIKGDNIYLVGYFLDSMDYGFVTLYSNTASAVFLRYNFDGVLLNAIMDNEYAYYFITDIAFDKNETLFLSGYLSYPYGVVIGKIPYSNLVIAQMSESYNFSYSTYPNPCTDKLNIVSNMQENLSFEIINISGQTIISNPLNNGINEINISELKSGIYLTRIFNSKISESKKIIKN